jgi:hypothetical protein
MIWSTVGCGLGRSVPYFLCNSPTRRERTVIPPSVRGGRGGEPSRGVTQAGASRAHARADESAPLDRQLEPQVALHGGSPFV